MLLLLLKSYILLHYVFISVHFRDFGYTVARCLSVCLSVCLPVCYWVGTVSHTKRCGNIPTETPNGGVECKSCRAMKKIIFFDQCHALSRDKNDVTMECE